MFRSIGITVRLMDIGVGQVEPKEDKGIDHTEQAIGGIFDIDGTKDPFVNTRLNQPH